MSMPSSTNGSVTTTILLCHSAQSSFISMAMASIRSTRIPVTSRGLVYGHEGGGHLPCEDMIDWSTGLIYVLQANRKTAQLNYSLLWSQFVAGINLIGLSPSSLAPL